MNNTKMKMGRFLSAAAVVLVLVVSGIFAGCQKETNPIDSRLDNLAVTDAAASVADAIGMDQGGAFDQVADILDISTSEGLVPDPDVLKIKFAGKGVTTVDKTYDSVTGWWSVNLVRKRGETGVLPYAEIYRSYQYQFLNKDGQFQKTWKVLNQNGVEDTAYSIHHKILSGTGISKNLRGVRNLLSLSGEWMVTGVNTPAVTINTFNNGSYIKTGSDTLKTLNAVRTLNHTLTLNFINVVGPRGGKLNLSQKTSGTITGTYHAVVTFQKGSLYKDKVIDKDINITLGSGVRGKALFDIGGWRFFADLESGDVQP